MSKIKEVNDIIKNEIEQTSEISDGYHTFGELYHHRAVLFSIICSQNSELAWKSKLHDDGTMYDRMFIVGISTPKGDYTYHFHNEAWDMFDVVELDKAPEWDGHKPGDIDRLFYLKDGYVDERKKENQTYAFYDKDNDLILTTECCKLPAVKEDDFWVCPNCGKICVSS